MRAAGPTRKLVQLCALYFAEGLPFGFQATALPAYLRQANISLTAIGFAGALALPWMLKPLWAPLVDRYGSRRFGRRKSWILPLQAGLALVCALASLAEPDQNLALLLGLVFAMNFFAATQDIAIDALAVDMLSRNELGGGNAVQVVGYKLGMIGGGGVLVYLSKDIGWQGLFLCMAALVTLVMIATAIFPEPASEEPIVHSSFGDVFRRIRELARVPGTARILIFIATYKLGESMFDRFYGPFLIDAGFQPEQLGLWLGTYGMVASVLGSIAGGWLATVLPLARAIAVAGALRILPMIAAVYLATSAVTPAGAIAVVCVEHFFGGALTTAMFAFMMSLIDRSIGATHYAALASIEVLGKAIGPPLGGVLADRFGYPPVFATAAAISLLFLSAIRPLTRRA